MERRFIFSSKPEDCRALRNFVRKYTRFRYLETTEIHPTDS